MNLVLKEDFERVCSSNSDLKYFENKTVLITGGTSLLFSYFVKLLLFNNNYKDSKSKTKVIITIRNEKKAHEIYQDYLNDENLTIIKIDLMKSIEIDSHIDIIIHAASQASPKYYGVDPCGTINANTIGTYNLLEFARKYNITDFLYISSSEVYGAPNKDSVSETDYGYLDCMNVRSCYAEGKRAGETMCVAYSVQYGIKAKIARFYHTYAPNMPLDDGRIFADFANKIINKKDIVLNSDGSAIRCFCYVSDAIEAIMRIIVKGESANAYNVANPKEEYSIKELAEMLCNYFSDRNIKVIINTTNKLNNGYIPSTVAKAVPSIEKMKALGFEPHVTVLEGFEKVIKSYE